MAYALRSRQLFEAKTSTGKTFTFTCYTQSTSYGCRELCCLGYSDTTESRYIKGDIIGKDTIYNRPWYRFKYENALRHGLETLLKDKDITQEEHDELYSILIDGKAQAEHEQAEKDIAEFQALFNKTSDNFKQMAQNLPPMTSESDVNMVKGLMALDIIFNSK